jgi:protein SCO1/2
MAGKGTVYERSPLMLIRSFILSGLLLSAWPGYLRCQADEINVNSEAVLIDEAGQQVTLDSYAEYLRLVFFGYTSCPDICPLTMYQVGAALKSLGPDAERIRVLFISIDPRRDTPAVLDRYTNAFHPLIIGLSAGYATLMAVTETFRTTFGYTIAEGDQERPVSRSEYESLPADAPYVPYHSSQIYMLDHAGRLLDIIGYGSSADEIAGRLRQYLGAGGGSGSPR